MINFIKKYKTVCRIFSGVALLLILTYVISIYFPGDKVQEEQVNGEQAPPVKVVDGDAVEEESETSGVQSFKLGSKTFDYLDGEQLTVDIKGKIAIPAVEGELPIVFLMSSPSSTLYSSSDYDQLLSSIAKEECVAIYLDLSDLLSLDHLDTKIIKQVFSEYRDRLNEIILGENVISGIDINNKGTFSKVVMVGFEDSVDALFSICEDQLSQQQLNIESILLINPNKQLETVYDYPDVLTSIVVDSTKEDVESLASLKLFEEYRQEKSRQALTSYTLIESDYEECETEDDKVPNSEEEESESQTDPQTKEVDNPGFLTAFISDFLDTTFEKENNNPIFSVTSALPDMLYNENVRSALLVPNMVRLINPFIESKATLNTLGGNNELEQLEMQHEKGDISIFRLTLNETPASITLNIPEENKDLSQYDNISAYMSVCTADNAHSKSKTELWVELTDETGQTSRAREVAYISSCDAKHGYHLSDERFVLTQFPDVDLKSITQIKLEFNDEAIETIILGDLSLVQKP